MRGWAVRDHDGFGERCRAARLLLLEAWADQIVDIADEADLDPRDRKVRVHTRRWLMSKLAPRRYGGRLLHASDPENPLRIMHQQVSFADLTDDQLEALGRFTQTLIEAKQDLDHPKRPFGRELIRIRTFRQRSCWRCKARRSALAVYGLTSRSNISGWTGDLKGQADLAFTFGLICRE